MSMNDNRGCSVCPAGSENYEIFTTRLRGKRVKRVQYLSTQFSYHNLIHI